MAVGTKDLLSLSDEHDSDRSLPLNKLLCPMRVLCSGWCSLSKIVHNLLRVLLSATVILDLEKHLDKHNDDFNKQHRLKTQTLLLLEDLTDVIWGHDLSEQSHDIRDHDLSEQSHDIRGSKLAPHQLQALKPAVTPSSTRATSATSTLILLLLESLS
ncbi:unnamed protein product [Pleuronectes platessa]|uniref:Uncharacterized protein n=1 Tax=Pleuronectes platessa TaxID=8262 RepID=A0A9N7TYD4_PLEPL|nr:unnamed protein product [Pleuronectes platessa]